MTQRCLRSSLGVNLASGCDAAGFEKEFRVEFWGVNVTQRCLRSSLGVNLGHGNDAASLRGSLEVNLGSGCDAAGFESQFMNQFWK